MKVQPSIKTRRLLLRPLVLGDAKDIQRIAGHEKVAETTRYIPHPYPDGYAEAWISSLGPNYQKDLQVVYGVVIDDEAKRLIGSVGFDFHREHNSADLGYWIDPLFWGQGYATEAAKGLVSYGFKVLGLNRVQAYCLAHNDTSMRVLVKVGMQKEGVARQGKSIRGRLSDIAYFGMLKSDFHKMSKNK